MIRIYEVKFPLNYRAQEVPQKLATALGVPASEIDSWQLRREAIDARKKTDIKIIGTYDVVVRNETEIIKKRTGYRVIPTPDESYHAVAPGKELLKHSPVVVGSGPAGLFAGLILAQAGYMPRVIERGASVDQRCIAVERFWREGILDPESNAQFGEGGAGTFSDGKLTTLINDPRCRKVLDEFVAAGAPPRILTSNKPHIGTDCLRGVVKNIRQRIIALGGTVSFQSAVSGLEVAEGKLCGIVINGEEPVACESMVLAVGHSARDTIRMLFQKGLQVTPKPFSMGLRIEHPQALINAAQFGTSAGTSSLGAADYKLAFHGEHGRSAYTFCMCPGGEVIAAASELGGVVTNGMSLQARNSPNANAALLVNIMPEDFNDDHPLAGFAFQAQWEQNAFECGGQSYGAPAQRLGDFLRGHITAQWQTVKPSYRPGVVMADLRQVLPIYVYETIKKAIPAFGRQLRGFDMADAVLTGVETRSSSPVRLLRGDDCVSNIGGLYPAGEGAGYAGGIMSAAVDGIRVAEAIITRYAQPR